MGNKWIVTDIDCNQQMLQHSSTKFTFKEDRLVDPESGKVEVFEMDINLEDYSKEEIVDCLLSYGYTEQMENMFTDSTGALISNAIIAECLFEQE